MKIFCKSSVIFELITNGRMYLGEKMKRKLPKEWDYLKEWEYFETIQIRHMFNTCIFGTCSQFAVSLLIIELC